MKFNYLLTIILSAFYFFTNQVASAQQVYTCDTILQVLASNIGDVKREIVTPEKINSKDSLLNICWTNKSIIAGWRSQKTNNLSNVSAIDFKDFTMPVCGPLSRGYTSNHQAWDIRLKLGDSVRTCLPGKVRYAQRNSGGYGNLVIIRGFNGLEYFYGHLSKILVADNQLVSAGQIIGLGGATGHATGNHLHFEVRCLDNIINVSNIIDFKSGTIDTNACINTQPTPKERSNFVYYKINKGDILSKIAAKYHITVSALCRMNSFKSNSILKIGKFIRVR